MKCFNDKCTSGIPGKYEPIVLLWGQHHSPMSHLPAELSMKDCLVCEPCKHRVTPRTFIRDQITWMKICNQFKAQRKMIPDITKAQLAFVIPESLKLIGDKVEKGRIA